MIDLPPESARIGVLWSLIRDGAAAGAVLDELTRTGISSTPDFILINANVGKLATILVRGRGILRLAGGAGERVISGEGVSSWIEQQDDVSGGFAAESASPVLAGELLPLEAGVVRARRVVSGTFSRDAVSLPILEVGVLEVAAVAPSADPERVGAQSAESHVEAPMATESTLVESVPADPSSVDPGPTDSAAFEASMDLEATLAAQTTTLGSIGVAPTAAESTDSPDPSVSSYDHLFGETVFRKVEDAAVRDDEPAVMVGPPPPAVTVAVAPMESAGDDAGDHDGHTVMVSDLAALRAKRKAAKAAASPEAAPAPTLYLELSTGGRETLDQPLIIGRAPTASRVPGGNVPRLVSMNTPNQDISRTHAQVTAEGGTVVVTDLHSSNGTTITLPGKAAQKLRPGEPSAVIVGTIIDLGDGATLTVCESS